MNEKLLPQTSSYCGGLVISGRDSDGVFCEMVCNDQDILGVMTVLLQGQKVHTNQLHWSAGVNTDQSCISGWHFLLIHLSQFLTIDSTSDDILGQ